MNDELGQKYDSSDCFVVGYQKINVCIPVTIKVYVKCEDTKEENNWN